MGDRPACSFAARLAELTVEQLPEVVLWVGADAVVRWANGAACSALGYAREELLGRTLHEVDTDLAEAAWEDHWDVLRQARRLTFDTHYKGHCGRVFPVELTVSHFTVESRECACIVARDVSERRRAQDELLRSQHQLQSAHDLLEARVRERTQELSEANARLRAEIEERHRVEAALRESEARYQALAEVSPALIFRADAHARFTYVNDRWTELTGLPPSTALGYGWQRMLADDDASGQVGALLRRAMAAREPWHGEFRLRHVGRPSTWVLAQALPEIGADGQLEGYVGALLDIGAQKRTEIALRESEQRYRQLYNRTPVMMHSVDERGVLVEVSDFWLETLGYRREEVLGRPAADFMTPDSALEAEARVNSGADEAGVVRDLEVRMMTRDGEVIDGLLSAIRTSRGHGEAISLAFIVDVTEQRRVGLELQRAKETAEAANRAKSEFLANMSHELRTPLNGVLGYAQILARRADLDAELQQAAGVIQRSGEHLLALINEVLDLARIEAGRLEIQPAPFDLLDLMSDIADLSRPRAEDKGLAFHYRAMPGVPPGVVGDAKRLRQVMLNLISNAIKFTPEGGVSVRLELAGEAGPRDGAARLRFSVEDTGIGIAAEAIDTIFQPFHQLRGGGQHVEGTGLGLSICREIARLMGGALRVDSAAGRGATFSLELELPVVSGWRRHAGQGECRRIGYRGPRRSVLVVDDRWENRAVVAGLLRPLGFEVREAEGGAEALAAVEQATPDAIIVDLVMPEMDGFELVQRLRARPELATRPIVASSASVFESNRRASLEAGCDDFVPKPVQAGLLLERLGERLGLEWEEAAIRCTTSDCAGEVRAPDDAVLDEIGALARRGHVVGVRRLAERLETEDPSLRPFVAELRRLLRTFQMKQVEAFVDGLRAERPTVDA